MAYYSMESKGVSKKWRCEECFPKGKPRDLKKILDRCCPLPQNKKYIDSWYKAKGTEKRTLGIRLANNEILEECPTGILDPWAISMWNEYNLRKDFGAINDLHEIVFKAFTVILTEIISIENIREDRRERDRKRQERKGKS